MVLQRDVSPGPVLPSPFQSQVWRFGGAHLHASTLQVTRGAPKMARKCTIVMKDIYRSHQITIITWIDGLWIMIITIYQSHLRIHQSINPSISVNIHQHHYRRGEEAPPALVPKEVFEAPVIEPSRSVIIWSPAVPHEST